MLTRGTMAPAVLLALLLALPLASTAMWGHAEHSTEGTADVGHGAHSTEGTADVGHGAHSPEGTAGEGDGVHSTEGTADVGYGAHSPEGTADEGGGAHSTQADAGEGCDSHTTQGDAAGSSDGGPVPSGERGGEPQTLVVSPDGMGDHRTIQSAIDNASAGDTILVGPGHFRENVFVRHTLSIIGAGANDTIIDGRGLAEVTYVSAPGCLLRGLTFYNGSGHAGLILNCNDSVVRDCVSVGSMYGIMVYEAYGNTIDNCTVYHSGHGMDIEAADGTSVSNCTSVYNYGAGINFFFGTRTVVSDCEFSDNGGSGIHAYWLSEDNIFRRCSAERNEYGIYVMDSDGCAALDCVFRDNERSGMYLSSLDLRAADCVSEGNAGDGVMGYHLEDSVVEGCAVRDNGGHGLLMKYSLRNDIAGNVVTGNGGHGVHAMEGSGANRIFGNDFAGNNNGTRQGHDADGGNLWGAAAAGGGGMGDNGPDGNATDGNATSASASAGDNATSAPASARPNYWHDWQGPDADGDGLVDVAYNMEGCAGVSEEEPSAAVVNLPSAPGEWGPGGNATEWEPEEECEGGDGEGSGGADGGGDDGDGDGDGDESTGPDSTFLGINVMLWFLLGLILYAVIRVGVIMRYSGKEGKKSDDEDDNGSPVRDRKGRRG